VVADAAPGNWPDRSTNHLRQWSSRRALAEGPSQRRPGPALPAFSKRFCARVVPITSLSTMFYPRIATTGLTYIDRPTGQANKNISLEAASNGDVGTRARRRFGTPRIRRRLPFLAPVNLEYIHRAGNLQLDGWRPLTAALLSSSLASGFQSPGLFFGLAKSSQRPQPIGVFEEYLARFEPSTRAR